MSFHFSLRGDTDKDSSFLLKKLFAHPSTVERKTPCYDEKMDCVQSTADSLPSDHQPVFHVGAGQQYDRHLAGGLQKNYEPLGFPDLLDPDGVLRFVFLFSAARRDFYQALHL